MPEPYLSEESAAELLGAMNLLLRRLGRQAWASPRQMQMDAGRVIDLLSRADLPNRTMLVSTLTRLVRELGNRKPYVYPYIVALQEARDAIERRLGRPAAE